MRVNLYKNRRQQPTRCCLRFSYMKLGERFPFYNDLKSVRFSPKNPQETLGMNKKRVVTRGFIFLRSCKSCYLHVFFVLP